MKQKLIRAISFTAIALAITVAIATADFRLAFSWIVIGIAYYSLVECEIEFEEYRKSHENPNPEH